MARKSQITEVQELIEPFCCAINGVWGIKEEYLDEIGNILADKYGNISVRVKKGPLGDKYAHIIKVDKNGVHKLQQIGIHEKEAKKKEVKSSNTKKSTSDTGKKILETTCNESTMEEKTNYEIIKEIAVLSTSPKGWTRELNLISWYGKEAKYDIRDWSPERDKMSKGISLSEDELETLCSAVSNLNRGDTSGDAVVVVDGIPVDQLINDWNKYILEAPENLRTYLKDSRLTELGNGTIVVNVQAYAFDALNKENNKEALKYYIETIIGKYVKIEFVASRYI